MAIARALSAALLAGALMTWSPAASAEDAAGALALFQEGRALMQEQSYVLACAKFAESQRLAPAPGTLLNLGECQRKLGKTATAWATFSEAATAAHRAGQSDREAYARGRADELEVSLPRLTVRVPVDAEISGLVIRRDGMDLGKGAWNTALPVDPGAHVVEASATGRRPWRTTTTVPESGRGEVTVPVLDHERDAAQSAPREPASRPVFTQRRVGLLVGGLGVASAAVGGFFGLQAIATNDEANGHCRTPEFCDSTGLSLKDDARGEAMLSTVFTIAGAAALIGGVVLFLTAKDTPSPPKMARSSFVTPGSTTFRW